MLVLATSNTNPYIGAWTSTFAKFATQLGMKVTNLSANYDAAVQSQQIDDGIAQKYDLIVLCYVNDQAVGAGAHARQGRRHTGRALCDAAEKGIRGSFHVLYRHGKRRPRTLRRRDHGQGSGRGGQDPRSRSSR